MEAIKKKFLLMRTTRERNGIMKQRAKREERIRRAMGTTIGTYGNINGIAGKTLQEVKELSFEASPDPSDGSLRETAS